jgi:Protein of unknown function (DUF3485)
MYLRIFLLALLTIVSTLIHGYKTHRWGPPVEARQHNEFVVSFPTTLGSWGCVRDGDPLAPRVAKELGISTHVSRVYASGDDTAMLLLMSGDTGRLVRHPPTLCYQGAGNTVLADAAPTTIKVDGVSHEFRVLPIRPASSVSGDFVVVFGFAHAGRFQSPAIPRFTYHGFPVIEKVQILCRIDSNQQDITAIPAQALPFVEEVCRHISKNQTFD